MKARPDPGRRGLLIGVTNNTVGAGSRARALSTPLRRGQVRCDTCGNGVQLRKDGSIKGHQAQRGVQCAGAPPTLPYQYRTIPLCEHGNFPNQRAATCGCPTRMYAEPA